MQPSSKTGVKQKKENALSLGKKKQTILKCLDFLPSLFKRPVCHGQNKKIKTHQSTAVAVDVRWCIGRRSSVSRMRRLLVCCRHARERRLRLSFVSPAPTPPFVALETAAGRTAEEEKLGYGWLGSAQPLSRTFFKIKKSAIPLFKLCHMSLFEWSQKGPLSLFTVTHTQPQK